MNRQNEMDTEKKSIEEMLAELQGKIDFHNGVILERTEMEQNEGAILDVRWKGDVHFILYVSRWNRPYFYYYVKKGSDNVSCIYHATKSDDKFFHSVQHLINEIENGDFHSKKTISDRVAEIVCERQLTSCMNNTKWREFLHAMDSEMSVAVPYDYKTLFEEEREEFLFGRHYDAESFNWYHFKSVEWVKVKPRFYERKHRGRLMEDEKRYYDVQQEFLDLMDTYSIPYEYDSKNEVFIIYGYK